MGRVLRMYWVLVPEQSPLQPLNVKPAAGVAGVGTAGPLSTSPVHALPQLIPPTLDVTVPPPGVDKVTLIAGLHPRKVQMVSHRGCDVSRTATIATLGTPQVVPKRGNPE